MYQSKLNGSRYEFRVLVCGGRHYIDKPKLWKTLSEIWHNTKPMSGLMILHGGASGADRLAGQWAERCGVNNIEFTAHWNQYGKRAGYVRNAQMLEEGKPDLVVAFPGGKGTAMMVKLARDAGVEVIEVE